MNSVGLDRKVLRAFYTQYVAVLLIVLVFFVVAFQRRCVTSSMKPPVVLLGTDRHVFSQPLELEIFSEEGVLREENATLSALAEILKQHDLRAEFTLSVARYDFESSDGESIRMALRADALKRYFDSRGIPERATLFVIKESLSSSSTMVRVNVKSEEAKYGL